MQGRTWWDQRSFAVACVSAGLSLASVGGSASADVFYTVRYERSGSTPVTGSGNIPSGVDGAVDLRATFGGLEYVLTLVTMRGTASGDTIGALSFTNQGTASPNILTIDIGDVSGTNLATEWRGVTAPTNGTDTVLRVRSQSTAMDITGTVSTPRVSQFVTLGVMRSQVRIYGANTGIITIQADSFDRYFDPGSGLEAYAVDCTDTIQRLRVIASDGDVGGRIRLHAGILELVQALNGGNIRGDIVVETPDSGGRIESIIADGGDIRGYSDTLDGSGVPATSLAYPNRIQIQSYRGIQVIRAKRVCAHISATLDTGGATVGLQRLYATQSGTSGGLYGSVLSRYLENTLGPSSDTPCIEVAGLQAATISTMVGSAGYIRSPIVVASGSGTITAHSMPGYDATSRHPRIESSGTLGQVVIAGYGSSGANARIIAAGAIERIEATGTAQAYLDIEAPNSTIGDVITASGISIGGTWNVGRILRSDIGGWIGIDTSSHTASFALNEMTSADMIRVRGGLRANSTITVGGASAPNDDNMAGTILFNYGTTTEDTSKWAGTVTVGGQTLSPTPSYNELSDTFGGGSVGIETPRVNVFETGFHSDNPTYAAQIGGAGTSGSPWTLPQGLFNRGPNIADPPGFRMSYYGPIVWPSSSTDSPVDVYAVVSTGLIWVAHLTEIDVDDSVNSGSFAHDLVLRGASDSPLLPGLYAVKLGGGLKHDFADNSLITPRAFTTADDGYLFFQLVADCNKNGLADSGEDPNPDCIRWGDCWTDFNGDHFLDFFDYSDFVDCFENAICPPDRDADFNGDSFVDFFDYSDFVFWFEHGC